MALVVLPRLDVIAGPHVGEAGPFGRLRLGHQPVGAELFVESTNPTPLPAGAGGAPDRPCPAPGFAQASTVDASTPAPTASRPNVRREMPVTPVVIPATAGLTQTGYALASGG